MTLQEIKDQVAKERGVSGWRDIFSTADDLWTVVASRYATECVKASLDKAAENANVTDCLLGISRDSIHGATADKKSITDPSNIILL